MSQNKFLKKVVAVFILISLFLPIGQVWALGPLDVPVTDDAMRTKEVGFSLFGVTSIGVTLDGIFVELARQLIETLTDETVEWISNRDTDEGGPAFAVDLEGFFKTTVDRISGNIIEGAGLGALCSPFQNQIREALRLSYSTDKRNADDIEASCTLSQVTDNIEGFLDGDFARGGGWDSWFLVSQDPNGNPFSATITTKGIVSRKVAEAVGIEKENLSWSDGFFNSRDCLRWQDEQDEQQPSTSEETPVCAEWGPTKTPGRLVEGQLQKLLGSEIDQLNIADEFDEILSALVGMLMDSVFNRDGLIDNSSLTGRAQTGGSQRQIFGACSPSKKTTLLPDNEAITWKYTGSQNVSLVWGGDEIPAGSSGREVTVVYTSAGQKSAFVTVTRLDASGQPVGNSQRIDCMDFVKVDRFGPLAMTCVGPNPVTVRFGERATWTINITGGSGQLSAIALDQETTLGPEIDNSDGPFWPGFGATEDVRPARIVSISPPAAAALAVGQSGFNYRPVAPAGGALALTPVNGAFTITFEMEYRYKLTSSSKQLSLAFLVIADADSSVQALNNARCGTSITALP